MPKKTLSRRERALIQHAVKRAIRQHEDRELFTLKIGEYTLKQFTLSQWRALNQLQGLPGDFTLYFNSGSRILVDHWRA